ncbi:hypothetical protein P154DRAFT_558342 [Amniculicola lignicola CBS 123094]|uniref:F-box domain-containing protein n=1 Tax=Amniculicola lignicola CBS 123094 TaxID=1392246 RepID=A0A6A5X595_9PLEO|nr:hypothetical protein P154DRAFT_558342 [Amniculicola lignicola CBS 123094]
MAKTTGVTNVSWNRVICSAGLTPMLILRQTLSSYGPRLTAHTSAREGLFIILLPSVNLVLLTIYCKPTTCKKSLRLNTYLRRSTAMAHKRPRSPRPGERNGGFKKTRTSDGEGDDSANSSNELSNTSNYNDDPNGISSSTGDANSGSNFNGNAGGNSNLDSNVTNTPNSGNQRTSQAVPPPINTSGIVTASACNVGPNTPMANTPPFTPVVAVPMVRDPHVFRFLDLPGELRNKIYNYTLDHVQQAVIRHRPKVSALRRSANWVSRRPMSGLLEVCRLIRQEFRPTYLRKQEFGIDYMSISAYIRTFYPEGVAGDSCRAGNMTLAVPDVITRKELKDGVDLWPLIENWANGWQIQAGFGRYFSHGYSAVTDGEAKDLYRLLGRKVQVGRKVSSMNPVWKVVIRNRQLASVIVRRYDDHRRPYIHIAFKIQYKEDWMTVTPQVPSAEWCLERGFDRMEYFIIKVSVALPTQPTVVRAGGPKMKYVPGPTKASARKACRNLNDGRFARR